MGAETGLDGRSGVVEAGRVVSTVLCCLSSWGKYWLLRTQEVRGGDSDTSQDSTSELSLWWRAHRMVRFCTEGRTLRLPLLSRQLNLSPPLKLREAVVSRWKS